MSHSQEKSQTAKATNFLIKESTDQPQKTLSFKLQFHQVQHSLHNKLQFQSSSKIANSIWWCQRVEQTASLHKRNWCSKNYEFCPKPIKTMRRVRKSRERFQGWKAQKNSHRNEIVKWKENSTDRVCILKYNKF